jgi:hypothetical protein
MTATPMSNHGVHVTTGEYRDESTDVIRRRYIECGELASGTQPGVRRNGPKAGRAAHDFARNSAIRSVIFMRASNSANRYCPEGFTSRNTYSPSGVNLRSATPYRRPSRCMSARSWARTKSSKL